MEKVTNPTSRKRYRRRKRPNPAAVILRAAVLIVLIGFASFVAYRYTPTSQMANLKTYYGNPGEGEAAVVLGSEIMDDRGMLAQGNAYLPYSFVSQHLNPDFYWDKDLGSILYTTPTETARYEIASQAGEDVFIQDDTIYLSLDLISRYTDLDVTVLQEPDRIAIQKEFTDLSMVRTMAKGSIRVLGGIKSKVLTNVESGTDLLLLDELEDWSHVATWDGYIGYIEKKKLNAPQTVTLEREFKGAKYSYIQMNAPVNLVWHIVYEGISADNLASSAAQVSGVNVVSPTCFSVLDNNGEILDYSTYEYVEQAHQMGMQVWGLVDNFRPGFTTYEVLSHYDSRQNLIQNLIQAALDVGMDGINIDFESLPPETIPHFIQFLRELSVVTHQNGLVLSADTPVPEGYSSYYRRDLQAKAVDYMIVMGYDEHYDGSEFAGSVASLPWVEKGIQDTLSEVPASRTILAMPFYTRVWATQAGRLTSEALGMESAAERAANADVAYWNTDTMQNYAQWEADGIKYQVWLEDRESIAEKVKLVPKYGLAGAASWRLGFEEPEIWNVISEGLAGQG